MESSFKILMDDYLKQQVMIDELGKQLKEKGISHVMSKRVTVVMDDENFKKLRNLQAKMIKESDKSVSFSRVINDIIRKGLTVS